MYGRIGNNELEFLETIVAMSLEIQRLAIACADLTDDPVAVRYAHKSLIEARQLQAATLEYMGRRRDQARAK